MSEKLIQDIIDVLEKNERYDIIAQFISLLEELDEDYVPDESVSEPDEEYICPKIDEEIIVVSDKDGFLSLA